MFLDRCHVRLIGAYYLPSVLNMSFDYLFPLPSLFSPPLHFSHPLSLLLSRSLFSFFFSFSLWGKNASLNRFVYEYMRYKVTRAESASREETHKKTPKAIDR